MSDAAPAQTARSPPARSAGKTGPTETHETRRIPAFWELSAARPLLAFDACVLSCSFSATSETLRVTGAGSVCGPSTHSN